MRIPLPLGMAPALLNQSHLLKGETMAPQVNITMNQIGVAISGTKPLENVALPGIPLNQTPQVVSNGMNAWASVNGQWPIPGNQSQQFFAQAGQYYGQPVQNASNGMYNTWGQQFGIPQQDFQYFFQQNPWGNNGQAGWYNSFPQQGPFNPGNYMQYNPGGYDGSGINPGGMYSRPGGITTAGGNTGLGNYNGPGGIQNGVGGNRYEDGLAMLPPGDQKFLDRLEKNPRAASRFGRILARMERKHPDWPMAKIVHETIRKHKNVFNRIGDSLFGWMRKGSKVRGDLMHTMELLKQRNGATPNEWAERYKRFSEQDNGRGYFY